MVKDFTGLLLVFIGLIIGLFTGFGFILTLIGLFMLSGQNENFKKSRNFFIGTLIASIAGFFVLIGMGGVTAVSTGMYARGGAIAGIVGMAIATIIMLIVLFIFNVKSYKYLMNGCQDIAVENTDMELADKCTRAYDMYKKSLIASTVLGCLSMALVWVPILNILLMIATICVGIWYFVAQIFIIVRVWNTYDLRRKD